MAPDVHARYLAGEKLPVRRRKVRVVELPVSATEDRVIGSIDLETALKERRKVIEPGLLAAANRGILYMDEVNVVDVLRDSAAMGVNTIEREGISLSHPARFTLIGTMNPEEGAPCAPPPVRERHQRTHRLKTGGNRDQSGAQRVFSK